MATTYTNESIVYNPATGVLTKADALDTIAINLLQVGDGTTGSLTINTGAGSDTVINESSLTRSGDFTLSTGSGSVIASNDIDVGSSNPLVISASGLASSANQNISLNPGSGTVTATNTLTVGSSNTLVVSNAGLTRATGDISITPTAGTINLAGNVAVTGTLRATGDIIGSSVTQVLIGDAFIDLLASNTSTSSTAGGFTVQMKTVGSTYAIASFDATSDYITFSSDISAVFSAGDIISVSGQTEPGAENNGLYRVASVTGLYQVNIDTAPPTYTPFLQNSISVAATAAGSPVGRKVNLAVLAVSNGALYDSTATQIPNGTFAYASALGAGGAVSLDFNNTWVSLAPASVTLQSAYANGNTIVMTNNNDFTISSPAGGDSAAILLDADKASHFTVTGADLTLSTSNSGVLSLNSAGNIGMSAAGTLSINATSTNPINMGSDTSTGTISIGTGASIRQVVIGSITGSSDTSIRAGTGGVSIAATTTGKVVLGDGTSTGAIEIGKESVARTVSIGNATGASAVNVLVGTGNFSLNGTGSVSIATDTNTGSVSIGTGNSARTITIGNASNTSNKLAIAAKTLLTDGVGFGRVGTWSTGPAAPVTGNIVYIDSSGQYAKSDRAGTGIDKEVVGVALATDEVHSVVGAVVLVKFDSAPGLGTTGGIVYLSSTAGEATMTAPTGGLVYKLGWLVSETAVGSLYRVHWNPIQVLDLS